MAFAVEFVQSTFGCDEALDVGASGIDVDYLGRYEVEWVIFCVAFDETEGVGRESLDLAKD